MIEGMVTGKKKQRRQPDSVIEWTPLNHVSLNHVAYDHELWNELSSMSAHSAIGAKSVL